MTDEPQTECAYCGGYIHAGQYPPLCSDYCILFCEYEAAYAEWARNEVKKDGSYIRERMSEA